MLDLYVRIRFRNQKGFEESKSFPIIVKNPETLTDEKCEQLLNSIAQSMLEKHPDYTDVVNKEFISRAEFEANRESKKILMGNDSRKNVCNIYFKGIGLFPEMANQNGFGEDGPEIPFRVPSEKHMEQMSKEDIEKLKGKIKLVCQKRFSKTPKDVVIISESEYDVLMQEYKNSENN